MIVSPTAAILQGRITSVRGRFMNRPYDFIHVRSTYNNFQFSIVHFQLGRRPVNDRLAALALPLGELSAKLTERVLLVETALSVSPSGCHLPLWGRQVLCDKHHLPPQERYRARQGSNDTRRTLHETSAASFFKSWKKEVEKNKRILYDRQKSDANWHSVRSRRKNLCKSEL